MIYMYAYVHIMLTRRTSGQGSVVMYLWFGAQSEVYELQVVVFVNQQVFLRFKETSIAADI